MNSFLFSVKSQSAVLGFSHLTFFFLFFVTVKDEPDDSDNLAALTDFKEEDLKEFDNAVNDFSNGKHDLFYLISLITWVLIFCVEFRELSHLTRDLSQAEKKNIFPHM